MTAVQVVGVMSTWREGELARLAHTSLVEADLDAVYVFEGPAGTSLETPGEPTPTDLSGYIDLGRHSTDAAKRTAYTVYLRGLSRFHGRPLWVIYLDGDEILVNGRMLRDLLQRVQWEDERLGRSVAKPDNGPTFSVPTTRIEHDGSLARMLCQVVRIDLIRRYLVSSHVIELYNGVTIQHGSRALTMHDTPQVMALEQASEGTQVEQIAAQMFVPTLHCEPHTIHRPHLRHPDRQAVRMHQQEHDELERLGLPTA